MKPIEFRVLTDEETAEQDRKCGASPSPRSTARCEDKPRHWERNSPASGTHSGRTTGGYWKFWPVSDAEIASDS